MKIEKLKELKHELTFTGDIIEKEPSINEIVEKLNEIIEVVNDLAQLTNL